MLRCLCSTQLVPHNPDVSFVFQNKHEMRWEDCVSRHSDLLPTSWRGGWWWWGWWPLWRSAWNPCYYLRNIQMSWNPPRLQQEVNLPALAAHLRSAAEKRYFELHSSKLLTGWSHFNLVLERNRESTTLKDLHSDYKAFIVKEPLQLALQFCKLTCPAVAWTNFTSDAQGKALFLRFQLYPCVLFFSFFLCASRNNERWCPNKPDETFPPSLTRFTHTLLQIGDN